MAGITESMSKMGGGGRHGIGGGMEHGGMKHEPMEHDGVPEHLKAMHEKLGGKHMHVHAHEAGYTTHHVGEDGKVEGPHDHQNMEELKDHMDNVLNEEEHEPSEPEDHDGLL